MSKIVKIMNEYAKKASAASMSPAPLGDSALSLPRQQHNVYRSYSSAQYLALSALSVSLVDLRAPKPLLMPLSHQARHPFLNPQLKYNY